MGVVVGIRFLPVTSISESHLVFAPSAERCTLPVGGRLPLTVHDHAGAPFSVLPSGTRVREMQPLPAELMVLSPHENAKMGETQKPRYFSFKNMSAKDKIQQT